MRAKTWPIFALGSESLLLLGRSGVFDLEALPRAQLVAMWRPTDKLTGKRSEIDSVLQLKCPLSDLMLLKVMISAEAHAPFVGRLETETAIAS